jgi:hypothetical protein
VIDQHEGSTGLANFPHGVQAGTAGADNGNVGLNFRFHGKRLSAAATRIGTSGHAKYSGQNPGQDILVDQFPLDHIAAFRAPYSGRYRQSSSAAQAYLLHGASRLNIRPMFDMDQFKVGLRFTLAI